MAKRALFVRLVTNAERTPLRFHLQKWISSCWWRNMASPALPLTSERGAALTNDRTPVNSGTRVGVRQVLPEGPAVALNNGGRYRPLKSRTSRRRTWFIKTKCGWKCCCFGWKKGRRSWSWRAFGPEANPFTSRTNMSGDTGWIMLSHTKTNYPSGGPKWSI